MTNPKIAKAGQSLMPLKTHTVKSKGKVYSYRGHKIDLWFSEEEMAILESAYNYLKSTKHRDFSDKERSTLPKFVKAVVKKYSQMIKRKYVD